MALHLDDWEIKCRSFVAARLAGGDQGHDLSHVERVVANARRLAGKEGARLEIVLPAAWLHDCVVVPKNDPRRGEASRLAAREGVDFLQRSGYPAALLDDIGHAIAAHSFSAGIPPRTLEAQVVQDADRLEALGAIGLARCLLTGAAMGTQLYDSADPFAESRPLDDKAFSIDHFYVKLLGLPDLMQTPAGRREAAHRAAFLQTFLDQLRTELSANS